MDIKNLYEIYLRHPSIQTDTRKIKKDDLFFALKGPNFNANEFAMQALDKGAAYAIIDEDMGGKDERLKKTGDVLQALQQLARYHRLQFKIPFIAITGSNGKTTTKELVHEVLSTSLKTYTTEGNLNNHIGIPLTILKIKQDAQVAVIEMGANHQHEIEHYCTYTLPTHGLITNCGKAHLEGFGGIEGVRKGKGELFDFLRDNEGTAFVNKDDDLLIKMSKGIKEVITYGTSAASVAGAVAESSSFLDVRVELPEEIGLISTKLVGSYNLPNILAAIAIGKYFGVSNDNIKDALEHYTPTNSRSQLIIEDSNRIILDAYNANPTSMKAAIENFASMEGSNKVLMLGSMMELGEESSKEHEAILQLIGKHQWKAVALVGENFQPASNKYLYFDSAKAAGKWFRKQGFTDSNILIKGSRATGMEKVLE